MADKYKVIIEVVLQADGANEACYRALQAAANLDKAPSDKNVIHTVKVDAQRCYDVHPCFR